MQYSLKKFTVGIVMLAVIVFAVSYAAFASFDVKILIDGEVLNCTQTPLIQDGTALVPMRDVFERLGASVSWDEETRSAAGVYKDVEITVFPDDGIFMRNGKALKLPVKPVLANGRILIPIRTVAESFGYSVMWRREDYTVSISTGTVMKMYFLDCGQADSIFIELPDGKCMLIDSAESSFGEELESFIRNLGYSHIDYIIATHPHSDHIGGMAHILNNFSVGTFYMPELAHTTKTYEKMLDALFENGCQCVYISRGSVISDSEYNISVLSPDLSVSYSRMNNYSAVVKLSYNDVSALFSADAEAEAEKDMIINGMDIDADVLKIGHHGSATSSGEEYLDSVSPHDAIISTGDGGLYGFPNILVEGRLKERGINIHRTDTEGNICMTTDGYIYVIEGDK